MDRNAYAVGMLAGALETLLWQATDLEGEPLDSQYALTDMDPIVRAELAEIIDAVLDDPYAWECLTDYDPWRDDAAHAGHDMVLTINGHGAGFWDRYYGPDEDRVRAGTYLSDLVRPYGSLDLYAGDDGRLYL